MPHSSNECHYDPCKLHVERLAIVLHMCALHYGTDFMIYISSPQPCRKASYVFCSVGCGRYYHSC